MSADALKPRVRYASDQMMHELVRRLLDAGHLSRAQADDLQSRSVLAGRPLDELVISERIVDEEAVLRILSELSRIPFHHLAEVKIQPDAVRRVPARLALRHTVFPVSEARGTITLAVCRVPDVTLVESLRMVLNSAVEWILCTRPDIAKSVKHFYGLGVQSIDGLVENTPDTEIDRSGADVSIEDDQEGVTRFVNQIIAEAIRLGATDIHIEPFETELRLRYRVDGMLQNIPIPQGVHKLRRAIASCVKIMADMNIAERRKTHDGRIKVRLAEDEFDLRVSILPTNYGETVNMRILNRKSMFIDLEHLGLSERQAPIIAQLAALPHGVVLLTGPTGSGKTTTLYALLSRINRDDVKVITVEDPIEYQMQGINQVQVNAPIGLSFAAVLRSILRHDPDIILIGEIRDRETADIAVRSSLTGHLVFSTLHTNDAPSAVTRLVDMGIEPYLVSSCLEGAIAQRLVRRVCPACAEPAECQDVILEEITAMWPDKVKDAKFQRGRGCPDCSFTGYHGRIALFEIMVMNDAIRSMVVHNRPSNEIRSVAMQHGLVTLRRDGWDRVISGMTTVDEVVRVARKVEGDEGCGNVQ